MPPALVHPVIMVVVVGAVIGAAVLAASGP